MVERYLNTDDELISSHRLDNIPKLIIGYSIIMKIQNRLMFVSLSSFTYVLFIRCAFAISFLSIIRIRYLGVLLINTLFLRFEYSLFDFLSSSNPVAHGVLPVPEDIGPQSNSVVVLDLPLSLTDVNSTRKKRWLSLVVTARLRSQTSWANAG